MRLEVSAGQCGWRRDANKVLLNMYMQYDPHVQQVIDEQLMVECDMARRVGSIVDMGVRSIKHDLETVASVPLTAVQSFGLGTSWQTEEDEDDVKDEIVVGETIVGDKMLETEFIRSEKLETPLPSLLQDSRKQRLDVVGEGYSTVSGWLDLTNNKGDQIRSPLKPGEEVRVLAKVKESEEDALLTTCFIASQAEVIQLTDEFGCSLNTNIMENFRSINNDITGVKEIVSYMTVPDIALQKNTEGVKLKCNLALCEGKCPGVNCERRFENSLEIKDSVLLETRAVFAEREVMNVVDEVKHEINNLLGVNDNEGTTLCLSQTRLVLAFGVLIIVIISSLLLSCYLWMKARKRMMPRPPIPIQRVPYIIPSRARPYVRVLT